MTQQGKTIVEWREANVFQQTFSQKKDILFFTPPEKLSNEKYIYFWSKFNVQI